MREINKSLLIGLGIVSAGVGLTRSMEKHG